ncbi:MAG: phosphoribosylformylglycinamidine cyclo-ligase [Ignavibacteriae bacterium]|nr:phosphoribosylformylglycinamidine cyclo-ligase [Ignavibacteriota bacterium]MCB9243203.1 phosphoribosylformylglycinamidine cyclo-ligase [Ignavibacteriales bacterium]
MKKLSYTSAGVNISKGDAFVDKIKPLVKGTFSKNVLSGIGNFGAFYKPDFKRFKKPVFVSSIDGVGTKLKIAIQLKKYDTVGEDLVNHCVNDIAVCGAIPIFFLDYYATGKLEVNASVDIMRGLVRGCKRNNCSLIGGETAEMPGLYEGKDFDLAGAIVGIVDQDKIVNSKNVKKGDVVIGIASDGLHTNGYSLVRKIFDTPKELNAPVPELKMSAGKYFLKTHKSYLNTIQGLLSRFKINSIAHITGGGLEGNTRRVVPKTRKLVIDWSAWNVPPIYYLLMKKGNVDLKDMRRTFNMGIGLSVVVDPKTADKVMEYLKSIKEKSFVIGHIE